MSRGKKVAAMIIVAPLMIGLVMAIGGAVVQALWNWLLPGLFGFPTVTFWQALGLLALCRLLFGGIGFRPHGGSHMRRRMAERMDAMTPEEREKFRHGMRERWGFGASPTSRDAPSA